MNEIDKQTNGPFLIELCFDVRTLPVIAKKPVVEPIVDEIEEIAPPRIVTTLVTQQRFHHMRYQMLLFLDCHIYC